MLEDGFLAISVLVHCVLVVLNVKGHLGKWKAHNSAIQYGAWQEPPAKPYHKLFGAEFLKTEYLYGLVVDSI